MGGQIVNFACLEIETANPWDTKSSVQGKASVEHPIQLQQHLLSVILPSKFLIFTSTKTIIVFLLFSYSMNESFSNGTSYS